MLISSKFWFVFAILFGMAAIVSADDKPALTLPFIDKSPVIDGVLDDSVWASAANADGFCLIKTTIKADYTHVRMFRDSKWLYLACEFSNAASPHIEFMVTKRDDAVQRDESVELFLDPGTDGEFYYHFVLSADNVQGEQRGRDSAWFIPWRSATRRLTGLWTAEIAIPITICAGYGNPDKFRINFLYNHIKVALDDYGAQIGRERLTYTWSPDIRNAHDHENFGYLLGMGDKPIEAAFLPSLDQVRIEPFNVRGAERYYTVSGLARNYSSVSGTVNLVVEDCSVSSSSGCVSEVITEIALASHGQTPFRMKVMVEDFTRRMARACIEDMTGREILARAENMDMSPLTLMSDVGVNRNYYTDEPEGLVGCRLGLPTEELTGMCLKIFDEQDVCVASRDELIRFSVVAFPLDRAKDGANTYVLALEDQNGNCFCREPFVFWKRIPKPGHEVKVDQFNQILLKDGRGIFPVGIYMHGVTHLHEEIFKLVADAGFNLMVRVVRGHTMPESKADAYMELAQKYNLMVSEWYGVEPKQSGKSMVEQEEIARANYKSILPGVERELKAMAKYPNFLFHKNTDEPNLLNWQIRMKVAEYFYRTAHDLDFYHPVYTLFARQIPDVPSAFQVGDIYTYDIYTYPGWGGWANDPVRQMAKFTAELRAATRVNHKAMMVAPLATALDPIRCPLPLSVSDQRAQTYTALIYGAKGLVYFCWSAIYAGEMWETLGVLANEIRVLAPALLASEPEQEIAYNPGQFDAAQLKFPMLHARLFRHPDGGYVLLVVSGSEFPVQAEFVIQDLPDSATVSCMFGDKRKFEVRTNKFEDQIESYGTRAYRIETGDLQETIKLTLNMKADESRNCPRILLRQEVAGIEKQKNHMPNPVFAKCRVYKRFPDFMRPACPMLPNLGSSESGWFLDADNSWNGYPSLCMRWTEPFAKIKHVAMDGNCWNLKTKEYGVVNSASLSFCGVTLVGYPKIVAVPVRHVFSFYAKGGKAGDKIQVYSSSFDSGKTFVLSEKWERYELSGLLRPSSNWWPGTAVLIRVYPGATVWINGLQMESGEFATEFSEQ